jgi:hypothetical protein
LAASRNHPPPPNWIPLGWRLQFVNDVGSLLCYARRFRPPPHPSEGTLPGDFPYPWLALGRESAPGGVARPDQPVDVSCRQACEFSVSCLRAETPGSQSVHAEPAPSGVRCHPSRRTNFRRLRFPLEGSERAEFPARAMESARLKGRGRPQDSDDGSRQAPLPERTGENRRPSPASGRRKDSPPVNEAWRTRLIQLAIPKLWEPSIFKASASSIAFGWRPHLEPISPRRSLWHWRQVPGRPLLPGRAGPAPRTATTFHR